MFVKKTKRINLECIVRGHIAGQAWEEFNSYGTINKKPVQRKKDVRKEAFFAAGSTQLLLTTSSS